MIYLDHAAATSVNPYIKDHIPQILKKLIGNASSIHRVGQESRVVIDKARFLIAASLGDKPSEVLFLSGATEALHLALVGSWLVGERGKIGVSPFAHSAVVNAAYFLQKHFEAEIVKLPVDENGIIDLLFFDKEEISDFSHVVIESVGSEVGLIQPVKKIGRIFEKKRKNKELVPLLIVDAAGATASLEYGLRKFKADMVILSGEKFGALPGVGALIKKERISLHSFVGGSQEFGYRGGTENSLGIWSLGEAVRLKEESREGFAVRCDGFNKALRQSGVFTETINLRLSAPHIFHGVLKSKGKSSAFLQKLDLKGFAVASGPACSSGSTGRSESLKVLGFSEEDQEKGIRVSFGEETTMEEVESLITMVKLIS